MKLRELAEEFYEIYVKAHNAPSEWYNKNLLLKNFILPHLGDLEVDQIRAPHLTRFTSAMLKTGIQNPTVNLRLKCLQKMLNWAKNDMEYIEVVPKFKMLPVKKKDAQFLDESQIAAMYDAVAGDRYWSAFFSVGIHCGLRAGEMRALQWKHVDMRTRRINICESTWSAKWETGETKSGDPRTVRLNDTVLGELGRVLRLGPYVFGWPPHGRMVGYARISAAMKRFLAAAGIPPVKQPIHILRHTFASHLAMRGTPISTLMKLMGHGSLDVTMRYAHLSPESAENELSKLNSFAPQKA